MHRRTFLQSAAAGVALTAAARQTFALANEKPKRVALVGCGWYGKSALLRMIQVSPVEVVALCDVDSKMLAEAAEIVASRQASNKKPKTYRDYRELIKNEDVDIVQVSTPDHWHCLPMIAAVQAGRDVYVEKPISVDVVEGQAMLAAARKHRRVVQVGTQRRSTPHIIEARDRVVREGKLGKIGLVEVYCYYHMRARETSPPIEPPEHLDYDLWTGPAPMRPFTTITHPRRWRAFMEYGNGIMGDMCIHMFDMVRWMLDLGWPQRIASSGGILVDKNSISNIPDTQAATFDYGDLQVIWQHRTWGPAPDPKYPWGATFYGDKGTLKVGLMSYDFVPQSGGQPLHGDVKYELEEYPEDKTEKDLEQHVAPALRSHMRNFLACVESREKPVADIEQGHISSASCILANLALETGRTFEWDAAQGRIKNDEEANRLLARPYRKPWEHPTPENV